MKLVSILTHKASPCWRDMPHVHVGFRIDGAHHLRIDLFAGSFNACQACADSGKPLESEPEHKAQRTAFPRSPVSTSFLPGDRFTA